MFQAALTTHDIDADSAIWTCSSIITDDRSLCRFSDDEEVSVCEYHNVYNCEWKRSIVQIADNCVLELTHTL